MRALLFLLIGVLCSCSTEPKPSAQTPAHFISDGTPVPGAPEPEIVQLRKIEEFDGMKHVTVGNAAGEYVLICNLDANKDYAVRSCLSPRPQQDYLLFRANTKWLRKGAKGPVDLKFMQDYSVKYNNSENVGLMPAKNSEGEDFGVYWLSSWTAKGAKQ